MGQSVLVLEIRQVSSSAGGHIGRARPQKLRLRHQVYQTLGDVSGSSEHKSYIIVIVIGHCITPRHNICDNIDFS